VNEKNNKFVKASLNKSSKALSCEFRLPDGTKHVRQALIDGDASKSWIQIAQMLIIVFDFVKTLGNFKRFRLLNDGCVNENRNARFIKFLSFMTQKEDLIELTQETACQHELSFSPDRIHGTQRRRTKKIARDEGINITSHKDMVDIGNKFISKTVADKKSEKELTIKFYDFSTISFKSNDYIEKSLMQWCETAEHVEFPSFIPEGKARALLDTVYYMHKFYCLKITKGFSESTLVFSVARTR